MRSGAVEPLLQNVLKHTVGKSGSSPTSVVYFQQRSHFSPWARSHEGGAFALAGLAGGLLFALGEWLDAGRLRRRL